MKKIDGLLAGICSLPEVKAALDAAVKSAIEKVVASTFPDLGPACRCQAETQEERDRFVANVSGYLELVHKLGVAEEFDRLAAENGHYNLKLALDNSFEREYVISFADLPDFASLPREAYRARAEALARPRRCLTRRYLDDVLVRVLIERSVGRS